MWEGEVADATAVFHYEPGGSDSGGAGAAFRSGR